MWPFKKQIKQPARKAFPRLMQVGRLFNGGADYENVSKEAFLKNVISFSCIREIAQAVSAVTWEVHEVDNNGESIYAPAHDVNRLLRRANPMESFSYLMYKLSAYLILTGNSALRRTTVSGGKFPKELFAIPTQNFSPLLDSDEKLIGYIVKDQQNNETEYTINPVTMDCDIRHIKLFNPKDDFYGTSATDVSAREIDTSNESVDWNLNLVRNQGNPGMIINLVADMSPEEFAEFEDYIEDKFSGSANASRNLILTGDQGTSVKPYSLTPAELEFLESNRELSRRIALAYGVPPMLLGIPGDNSYSNQRVARQAFFETTVAFYLKLYSNELTHWIFGDDHRHIIKYNDDNVTYLEDRLIAKYRRIEKATFLTVNEKRRLAGFGPVDGGDVVLTPQTMIPLGGAPVATESKAGVFTEEELNLLKSINKNV